MDRPYHHGNLRAALVEAAVELARSAGPDGVVLREVARRTGVSHNAAYRHFSDRDQLLAEVAAWAMGQLAGAMQEQLGSVRGQDPGRLARGRLRAVGRAYVGFALAEPGLFDVAFAESPVAVPEHGSPAAGEQDAAGGPDPYAILNRVLDELVQAGVVSGDRRAGAEVACWAAVHGFAVLHLHGPLRQMSPEERERALTAMLDVIELGLVAPRVDA